LCLAGTTAAADVDAGSSITVDMGRELVAAESESSDLAALSPYGQLLISASDARRPPGRDASRISAATVPSVVAATVMVASFAGFVLPNMLRRPILDVLLWSLSAFKGTRFSSPTTASRSGGLNRRAYCWDWFCSASSTPLLLPPPPPLTAVACSGSAMATSSVSVLATTTPGSFSIGMICCTFVANGERDAFEFDSEYDDVLRQEREHVDGTVFRV
jgi:hypothetical protein